MLRALFISLFILFMASCTSPYPIIYFDGSDPGIDVDRIRKVVVRDSRTRAPVTNKTISEKDLTQKQLEIIEPIIVVGPRYPAELGESKIADWVVVEFTIDTNGVPEDVMFIRKSEHEAFNSAALKAVKSSQYRPVIIENEIVSIAHHRRKVTFQIGD